jgi:hypothetical protein
MTLLPEQTPPNTWLELTQCLLDSYRQWTGNELISRTTPERDLLDLWNAPFVVVAHDAQEDPILQYGNWQALQLWELPLDRFVTMPSRLTAEPMHRDERERLLERTRKFGYVDDYRGIRISSTGKRFVIEKALLWNVQDGSGERIGQAATFANWTPLS